MLGEKHQRSSTVKEKELTIEGRHHLLLLHKRAHDKNHYNYVLVSRTRRFRSAALIRSTDRADHFQYALHATY